MTIPEITRRVRRKNKLTLENFGNQLAKGLPGYTFTRQAIFNWENDLTRPDRNFLILCTLKYGDWRRDWAFDCLHAIAPDVFAPATGAAEAQP